MAIQGTAAEIVTLNAAVAVACFDAIQTALAASQTGLNPQEAAKLAVFLQAVNTTVPAAAIAANVAGITSVG